MFFFFSFVAQHPLTALSPWRRCQAGQQLSQRDPASKPGELAVRAHRAVASPAVTGGLQEQTGGGEEEGDERKEERTGGEGWLQSGEEKHFFFVCKLAFCYDSMVVIHPICLEKKGVPIVHHKA